jgi:hypothetical protein
MCPKSNNDQAGSTIKWILRIFRQSFNMIRQLIVLSLVVSFLSCSSKKNEGIYNEGKLEYKISYLNAEEDNYDPSFLPKKMTLIFNQDFCINQIDGFMGFFKLGNMTYFRNRKVRTHLKVLDKNYAFKGERNEMMCCFDCMSGMVISEDTATNNIGGLASKKAIVSFKDNQDTFSVYYTNDIKLAHPNQSNPYHLIDGVLTSFRLTMGPYLMQFTATKFDPAYKADKEMEIPSESIEVNREEMVTILARLMEQNK